MQPLQGQLERRGSGIQPVGGGEIDPPLGLFQVDAVADKLPQAGGPDGIESEFAARPERGQGDLALPADRLPGVGDGGKMTGAVLFPDRRKALQVEVKCLQRETGRGARALVDHGQPPFPDGGVAEDQRQGTGIGRLRRVGRRGGGQPRQIERAVGLGDQMHLRPGEGDLPQHHRPMEQTARLQVDEQPLEAHQRRPVRLLQAEAVDLDGQQEGVDGDPVDRGPAVKVPGRIAGRIPAQDPRRRDKTGEGIAAARRPLQ